MKCSQVFQVGKITLSQISKDCLETFTCWTVFLSEEKTYLFFFSFNFVYAIKRKYIGPWMYFFLLYDFFKSFYCANKDQ